MTWIIAVGVGLLVGISLGALGAGGSILTVPALVYLLDQPPAQATTGSLIIVGASALSGALAQRGTGGVKVGQGLTFAVTGVLGSWVGVRLAARVDPTVLMVAFAGLMLVVAVTMIVRQVRSGQGGEKAARPPVVTFRPFSVNWVRLLLVLLTATGVGLLTGFFGVGGGFVVVPALVLALGFTMKDAVATSLVVISANSFIALGLRVGHGISLDWPLVLAFAAAAILGGLAGARVARRVKPRTLTIGFIVVLVLIAGYTLATSLPQL